MYSLWNSGFNFQFEKENTDNIIFDNFSNVIKKTNEWTIQDVYDWIISLNMNRSILIANCFTPLKI
jgi:hypothetical protein